MIALGTGAGTLRAGDTFRFAFCTVFTFRGDVICRVESFVAPLDSSGAV